MGTKANPGRFDCYRNAAKDEPRFVLLGRDAHAPAAVVLWAELRLEAIVAGDKPPADLDMVIEACECARSMLAYRRQRQKSNRRLARIARKPRPPLPPPPPADKPRRAKLDPPDGPPEPRADDRIPEPPAIVRDRQLERARLAAARVRRADQVHEGRAHG